MLRILFDDALQGLPFVTFQCIIGTFDTSTAGSSRTCQLVVEP
jgi:hypothetical protein